MNDNSILYECLRKYQPRNLTNHFYELIDLQSDIRHWASTCYVNLLESGSRAKGTAISLASDVDLLISLSSDCEQSLKEIYISLYEKLRANYSNVRKQNVSIRVNLRGLEIDITPARLQPGSVDKHWIYVSKLDSHRQTNIEKNIHNIQSSGLINEIKIMKIWRELNQLDIPSTYLEYLIVNKIFLFREVTPSLATNTRHILNELASIKDNPLFSKLIDPSNTTNVLSDLMTVKEKELLINKAKLSLNKPFNLIFR